MQHLPAQPKGEGLLSNLAVYALYMASSTALQLCNLMHWTLSLCQDCAHVQASKQLDTQARRHLHVHALLTRGTLPRTCCGLRSWLVSCRKLQLRQPKHRRSLCALTSTLRLSSSSSATRAAMASRRTVGTSSSCCATASSMIGPPRLQMEFLHSAIASQDVLRTATGALTTCQLCSLICPLRVQRHDLPDLGVKRHF